ncbi:MAG: sugar MFS transporter [Bacteroidales bacterium]|nr:sugar MFS transporter [Bacteroidales bacterium]
MISITILFFMWGFITSLNDILIPYLKNVYCLSHFEANIVQFAFFIAYFIGSLAFFFWSKSGKDTITKYGYKITLVIGLVVASVACFLFAMSAKAQLSFGFFLAALFILGLGLTFLQIAANPFVARIGNSNTASSRLNLSQAFNSLGTTLGPALGGYFIFSYFLKDSTGASAVIVPYFFLSALLLLLAVFIFLSKINDKLETETDEANIKNEKPIWKKPYVLLGALGIFFYVGGEVAVGSNLVSFLKETAQMPENIASSFLSYYWGGAMIGRFLGAVSLSNMKSETKIGNMIVLAWIGFLVVFIVNYYLNGLDFIQVAMFLAFLILNFGCSLLSDGKSEKALAIFSVVNIILIVLGITMSGNIAIWALLSIGLFNSIMWSNVFTLAIDKLGNQTAEASSILIMMILGGALLPPLQGWLADFTNIRLSFLVPMISYIYLLFYGLKGFKIGKS